MEEDAGPAGQARRVRHDLSTRFTVAIIFGLLSPILPACSLNPPGDSLARAQKSGSLVCGSDKEGGGPYAFPNPDSPREVAGFEVDLMNEVAKDLKTKVLKRLEAAHPAGIMDASKISEAQGYYDETVRRADGEAKSIVDTGLVASNLLVQTIAAETKFFRDQVASYDRNPGLFRERYRITTVSEVLTNAPDKFFLPERADGQRRELRINLNREPASTARKDPNAPAR